jgi:hypothetical protein
MALTRAEETAAVNVDERTKYMKLNPLEGEEVDNTPPEPEEAIHSFIYLYICTHSHSHSLSLTLSLLSPLVTIIFPFSHFHTHSLSLPP